MARYAEIPILREPTTESSKYLCGNLGQDLADQFDKVTLNFEMMSIVFE
jgi:hypothetical protein